MDCAKLREDISRLAEAKKELEEYGNLLFGGSEGKLSDFKTKETAVNTIQDEILQSHLKEFAEKNQIIDSYNAYEMPSELSTGWGKIVPLSDGRFVFYSTWGGVKIVNYDEAGAFEIGNAGFIGEINDIILSSNGDLVVKESGEKYFVLCAQDDGSFEDEKLFEAKDYFVGKPRVVSLSNGDILACGETEADEDSVILFKKREDGPDVASGHRYELAKMAALYERNQSDMRDIERIIELSSGDIILSDENGKLGVLRITDESGNVEFEFERQDAFNGTGMFSVKYWNESPDGYLTIIDGTGGFATFNRGDEGEYEQVHIGNIGSGGEIRSYTPLPNGDSLIRDHYNRWHLYGRGSDGDYRILRNRLDGAFENNRIFISTDDPSIDAVTVLPDETLLASCSNGEIKPVVYDPEKDSYGIDNYIARIELPPDSTDEVQITGLPNGDVIARSRDKCSLLRNKANATLEDLKRKLPDIAAKRL